MGYSTVIFDCDGVLFDSNALKTQAFVDALDDYPQAVRDAFVCHHKAHGGVSRYVKFRHLFEGILQREVDEEKVQALLRAYGARCRELYAEAQLTPGCEEVLERLTVEGRVLYVASGSDEAELREVFAERGLAGFFREVLGSPRAKADCVAEVLRDGPYEPSACLMIGDTIGDWQAATENGVHCVLMADYSESEGALRRLASAEGVPLIGTLAELGGVLGHEAA